MRIRTKIFLAFLIPNALTIAIVALVAYKFELYQYIPINETLLIMLVVAVLATLLTLFIITSSLVEYMINRPINKLSSKLKFIESGNIEAYETKQDKSYFGKATQAINGAVIALRKQKNEMQVTVQKKNEDIEELNKKLRVDEGAAMKVFKELKEIDRMKTEFISLASHQLRTPLSTIKWGLGSLAKGDLGNLNDKQKEYATNVYESNERMIDLVNQLLNVSRIESGRLKINPTPTNLEELVQNVIKDVKADANSKMQKIVFDVHGKLPKINIDSSLVHHIYLNLLSNAIKYSPKEETISIEIAQRDDDIISKVTDNGCGIPESDKERIFEKFFRTDVAAKMSSKGTGLGLYLAKAIVEALNGIIWFESHEGKGTTFYFSLPVKGVESKEGEVKII